MTKQAINSDLKIRTNVLCAIFKMHKGTPEQVRANAKQALKDKAITVEDLMHTYSGLLKDGKTHKQATQAIVDIMS